MREGVLPPELLSTFPLFFFVTSSAPFRFVPFFFLQSLSFSFSFLSSLQMLHLKPRAPRGRHPAPTSRRAAPRRSRGRGPRRRSARAGSDGAELLLLRRRRPLRRHLLLRPRRPRLPLRLCRSRARAAAAAASRPARRACCQSRRRARRAARPPERATPGR